MFCFCVSSAGCVVLYVENTSFHIIVNLENGKYQANQELQYDET